VALKREATETTIAMGGLR